MPNIGDEIRGKDLDKITYKAKRLYVWVKCPYCLEERWAQKKSSWDSGNNKTRLCPSCNTNRARTFRLNPEKAAKEERI